MELPSLRRLFTGDIFMSSTEVMDKCATKTITNIDHKVRDAQIELLYKQTYTGLVGALIVALAACVIFMQVVPQWKLGLWAGIIAIQTLVRAMIVLAFKRRDSLKSDIDRWAKLHVTGVFVSGLVWGIPFAFLWPAAHPVYQMIWPIIIIPISAASVAAYYTWAPSYISFLILTALPMSLRLFFEGGSLFYILGFLCLFFIAILLRAANVMHAASKHAFEIGIRNQALNEDLNVGISKREQLNARLQEEIAERKLAENEIRKLSKVFLDGTNPSLIEDLNGNILEMNDEALNIYGFSREELVGKSIKLLAPEKNHKKIDELIKLCMDGKLVRDVEGLQRKKNGVEIPVLMTLSLLIDEDKKPFGIASIASDITGQKNIEKELIKSKAAAESANATKDKFFKIISHDLRSPFNSIIGFSNLLNTQYDSFDDEERKEFIGKMNISSIYAYDLLDNLLTWARTQTDEIKITKEKLNLYNLVEASVSTYLLNADSKNISIVNQVQDELIISIDENTALTFIRNIMSNAIKFTPEGGRITIDSQLTKDCVELHITDTGVGMSPKTIDNLFQIGKGISTDGTNCEKGTGLGLILCKEFIERNGGSISVKSEVNKGSEFIISLPLGSD
ncbi:PAS domain-containing sensor histidine kinase [Ancylomarina sp. 16SWW S1-10-2]|uniref:sensor histidine kinase n=1 Tax=Ancylomarina sp. 16SWW S1-10-2 TaxID=2499681 RepID=UPI0012AD395A|nr:PAS domain-containing sensor histidine kinase [Ancylomarina sp. 16SWW S1-10-2]MRT93669.1 PAS domain S-box protein [Ancylomarina sp. 16SWW S1-10-2]